MLPLTRCSAPMTRMRTTIDAHASSTLVSLHPEQIARMARLGVIAINQPSYLYEMGDQFIADFGERVHALQPWRDELEAGVRVVISSDSDVASYRPLDTIAAALSRTTEGGASIGPDQALTLNEALFAHTVDAAFAVGWEDEIGSLAPGKRADLHHCGR